MRLANALITNAKATSNSERSIEPLLFRSAPGMKSLTKKEGDSCSINTLTPN